LRVVLPLIQFVQRLIDVRDVRFGFARDRGLDRIEATAKGGNA